MTRFKTKVLALGLFFLFLANFYVWRFILEQRQPLEIIFFDIGQGDAVFVETAKGHQILIDGGPGKKILSKLAKEIPFWDNSLDLVILTHPDYDHLAGLWHVLQRYKVENILWNGALKETEIFERWQEKIKKEKAKIVIAKKGQQIKAGALQIDILHPFKDISGALFKKNTNDSSIVSRLLFGKNSFLFTGDISAEVEKELLLKEIELGSDVLKVAHHGSKNSSSREFLKQVLPQVAVISCGKNNPYGYPHQRVLRNLQEFGTILLRTDQEGDIKIVADGTNYKIR